jgi:hypothetical protein
MKHNTRWTLPFFIMHMQQQKNHNGAQTEPKGIDLPHYTIFISFQRSHHKWFYITD